MAEERSKTDEWARAIRKAQAAVTEPAPTRQRRITDELALRDGKQWKNIPLTVGMLVAIVYGFIWVASEIRGYYSDMDSRIRQSVEAHWKDKDHQHLNQTEMAAFWSMRERMRELNKRLTQLEKPRTTRRR